MKIWFFVVCLFSLLQAQVLNTEIAPFLRGSQFEGIKLLDQKVLDFKTIDGVKFSEISDLAYDNKEKKLYFVSDENNSAGNKYKKVEFVDYRPHPGELLIKEDGVTKVIHRRLLYARNNGNY